MRDVKFNCRKYFDPGLVGEGPAECQRVREYNGGRNFVGGWFANPSQACTHTKRLATVRDIFAPRHNVFVHNLSRAASLFRGHSSQDTTTPISESRGPGVRAVCLASQTNPPPPTRNGRNKSNHKFVLSQADTPCLGAREC